jgi:hypothetical protein
MEARLKVDVLEEAARYVIFVFKLSFSATFDLYFFCNDKIVVYYFWNSCFWVLAKWVNCRVFFLILSCFY